MRPPPDFDPYELLGVDASADSATVDRAYKARIRYVHPDIAGAAGLEETKRLNVAREWLLDAELRAQLPRPRSAWRARPEPPPPTPPAPPSRWRPPDAPRSRPAWEYDPLVDDPLAYDFGPTTRVVEAFFATIRSLTSDERARVTYSLGDEPPVLFDQFKDLLGERLWARSRALRDAVDRVWTERASESAPLLFPRGRVFGNGAVVANSSIQWSVLGDIVRERLADRRSADALAERSSRAWDASVGHSRYGGRDRDVIAFLDDARRLSMRGAERLARAWERDMGRYLYGRPGEDWFPGGLEHPAPELVSARLAAVDASRIEPPEGLPYEHHNGFRFGLRLTAHVLALGGPATPGRDYLRPWREAVDASPSFFDRARYGLPVG